MDKEAEIGRLAAERDSTINSVGINARLNSLETSLGKATLKSFPVYITLPMTNVCNARCSFCHYVPKAKKFFIIPETLAKLTWLRHIETICVNGGYGDSLANPHFVDVLRRLRELAPFSKFQMSSNGIGLIKNDKLQEALCEELSFLLISLNASNARDWSLTMFRSPEKMHLFPVLLDAVKAVCKHKPSSLHVRASIVVHSKNLEQLENFIQLAIRLGVDAVTVVNYQSVAFMGEKNLSAKYSLYYNKEKAQETFLKAVEIGKAHGVDVDVPDFKNIHEKQRHCYQPFNNLLLTNHAAGDGRDARPCCAGFPTSIDWDYEWLNKENFFARVWNHPVLQYMRKSQIDKNLGNLFCSTCLRYDIFNPEHTKHYVAAWHRMRPVIKNFGA